MKEKILNEFLKSNVKIKCNIKLLEYINFVLDNNTNKHIKYITNYHHILPKANDCFPEYKDLKLNPWNGVHLKINDHKYAHRLLSQAIISQSQNFVNIIMNNSDILSENICKVDMDKIIRNLDNKTKETYLGKTIRSKNQLNIANKLHLIGLYSEEIINV